MKFVRRFALLAVGLAAIIAGVIFGVSRPLDQGYADVVSTNGISVYGLVTGSSILTIGLFFVGVIAVSGWIGFRFGARSRIQLEPRNMTPHDPT
ncbi:MAG: hypothetical protein ABUT11_00820 [Leifsonia sp.]